MFWEHSASRGPKHHAPGVHVMRMAVARPLAVVFVLFVLSPVWADDAAADRFRPMDGFQPEYASDPQVSPDGSKVVYVRNFMDVMKDRRRSNLWIIGADGGDHRPLTTGKNNDHSPRWSVDGKRLVYVSNAGGSPQLWCRWMDDGQTAKLTDLTAAPGNPTWSPDGKSIAFSMHVADAAAPFVQMPARPEGAVWSDPPKGIRTGNYRFDGGRYPQAGPQ